MKNEIDQALQYAGQPDRTAPAVSHWSIHQHLAHIALSLLRFAGAIRGINAGEGQPGGRPKTAARLILLTGKIPRGRAQSPDHVIPADAPEPARIRKLIEEARVALHAAGQPQGKNRIEHPLLGPFTAKQWLRFAEVHTRHHLAIAREIDRRCGAR